MAGLGLNGNGRPKVVPFSEVKNRVVEGWEFVQLLPNGEAVVKLPQDGPGILWNHAFRARSRRYYWALNPSLS